MKKLFSKLLSMRILTYILLLLFGVWIFVRGFVLGFGGESVELVVAALFTAAFMMISFGIYALLIGLLLATKQESRRKLINIVVLSILFVQALAVEFYMLAA